MRNTATFEEWDTYPENLDLGSGNRARYDCNLYRKQLHDDSHRLFIENQPISLKVIEVGGYDQHFHDVEGLQDYLESSADCKITRLFLVPQQSSWGSLVITLEAISKLLTSLVVHPAFIDVLRAFGQKTDFEDDSVSSFHFQTSADSKGYDISYLVKHVEEHGRSEVQNPWSVRQTGIYHKSQPNRGDVFVIINPSTSFQRRLKQIKMGPEPLQAWEPHVALLSCAMEKWRWCVTYVEREYTSIKSKAQVSNVVESFVEVENFAEKASPHTDIHFGDTQDLQVLQDHSVKLSQFLAMNRDVLQQIHRILGKVWKDSYAQKEELFTSSLIINANEQIRRIETVLRRLEGSFGLVRAILDFRCLESLQSNSRKMTEMTRLAQKENGIGLALNEKASRDTDVLKTLTLMALVYLPASFVSSMMGMGYIETGKNEGHFFIRFQGEFWIFLVLTVVLLMTTLCGYYWWLRSRRLSEVHVRYGV